MYKQRDVENLWSKYEGLLNKLESPSINSLLECQGQRIIMGTFSQREKEQFCGIGGLVEYALELAKTSSAITKALNYDLSKASIIKCSLLSVLGRVGTLNEDRFVDTTSEWHKEKLGQYFDWNELCPKYQVNDMTLFWLQSFGVELSWDEWNAILLLRDNSSEVNKFYGTHKSRLATVLCLANEAVLKDELDKISGQYTVPF
tara:strand:- start:1801 stop:2406 length:606 start_codon:yes stop_codon:yes gene_type:complete